MNARRIDLQGSNSDCEQDNDEQKPHGCVDLTEISIQSDHDQDDISNQNTRHDEQNHSDPRELKSRKYVQSFPFMSKPTISIPIRWY